MYLFDKACVTPSSQLVLLYISILIIILVSPDVARLSFFSPVFRGRLGL